MPRVSRRGILFSVWSHIARGGSHFDCHSCFPQRGIWCVSIHILGSVVNFSHAQVGRLIFLPHFVVCVSLPSGFIVENRLLFPHVAGCVGFTFWDCCRLFWSRFGHDRAKNDSGVVFLAQAVNRLCDCVYAVVGLQTVLEVGMGD